MHFILNFSSVRPQYRKKKKPENDYKDFYIINHYMLEYSCLNNFTRFNFNNIALTTDAQHCRLKKQTRAC